MKEKTKMVYEQPVNEHMRVFLRLEYLLSQLSFHLTQDNPWNTHAAMVALVDILSLLDRPDLKTKLLQEFRRLHAQLSRLSQHPEIDNQKLQDMLKELSQYCDELHGLTGKIGQHLRNHEFLTYVRQHLLSPGGTCNFDSPLYDYWIHQSVEYTHRTLTQWWQELALVRQMVQTVLMIVRSSQISESVVAHQGFYQSPLDPSQSCQMVRVTLSADWMVFPEISVGKHRMYVRFCTPSIHERPIQSDQDIGFELARCVI